MSDKYYVYRPLLDLIGHTEGTDKGRKYNETLAYGKLTGGDVTLVGMNLRQVDALQTKMLKHPDNKWNSSAVGRYQIVRTTLRNIRKTLDLSPDTLFDADTQDQMACFLLGQRGIDKYLSGRLSEDTLINNLAKEWASLPTTSGKGHYAGQNTPITVDRVREVLKEVVRRHKDTQPKQTEVLVPDPGELSTNPAKSKTVWQWIITSILVPVLTAVDNPYVQGLIVVIVAAMAVYAIKRRVDLFKEAKDLLDAASHK